MKLKLITLIAFAGIVLASCGTNRNDNNGGSDSNTIDTSMSTQDTTLNNMDDSSALDSGITSSNGSNPTNQ